MSISPTCLRAAFIRPGVNFINILRRAFALVAPKSVIIQSSCQYLFTLLGSTGTKAASRTLMKLTPDPKSAKISQVHFFALLGSGWVKAAHKMLVK